MAFGRRRLFGGVSLTGLAWMLGGCSDEDTAEQAQPAQRGVPAPVPEDAASRKLFVHGVASGDPVPDGVLLWTRLTTDQAGPIEVEWQVASEPTMNDLVKSGKVTTGAERDHTVKADVTGLQPGVTYYFRFVALGGSSPIGRTRTAPAAAAARLRLGVVSCSNIPFGFLHAYRALAKMPDLDLIVHLGDYIYEYAEGQYGNARPCEPPTELFTLSDYRTRHAQYKRDPDLQAVHQQHPMAAVWDDHEFADNAWTGGAVNHDPAAEGDWAARKAAAIQAYFEWMPVREQGQGKIWRRLSLGGMADLFLLDTRAWGRQEQVKAGAPEEADPARQILGADQEAWLFEGLASSSATWKFVGQQVVLGHVPNLFQTDAWSGYPAARERLLGLLRDKAIKDVVVLTGDVHSSWVNELTFDPASPDFEPGTGKGSLAVELVVPAVSSPGAGSIAATAEALVQGIRSNRYIDFFHRGYVVLDVTPERVQADYYHYDTPEEPEVPITFAKAWSVARGSTAASEVASPTAAVTPAPALAPALPKA